MRYIYAEIRRIWGILSTLIANFQINNNLLLSYKSLDPKELFLLQCNGLESYRPGIAIRYMAVKDIVGSNHEYAKGLQLYKKYISIGNNNNSLDIYANKLTFLVNSFVHNGYNSDFYLLCDRKMDLMDGHHRLTCALFFREKTIRIGKLITSRDQLDQALTRWGSIKKVFNAYEVDLIRHESDLLVESVINDYKKDTHTNFDSYALRKWIVKELKKNNYFEYCQSFPMLGLNGVRSTDLRIAQYGLKELLNTKMDVLDIGCHIGFFDLEIASLVHSITGVELNPKISRLSLRIARKLSIYNAAFFSADFKEWESMSRRKYDMILSFANYREVGSSSQVFVAKIVSLIKPSGYVLFEGYDIASEANNDYGDYIGAFTSRGFRIIKNEYIMDDSVTKRIWTLLQYNE